MSKYTLHPDTDHGADDEADDGADQDQLDR